MAVSAGERAVVLLFCNHYQYGYVHLTLCMPPSQLPRIRRAVGAHARFFFIQIKSQAIILKTTINRGGGVVSHI